MENIYVSMELWIYVGWGHWAPGNRMWSIYEILFKALPPLTARNSLFQHLHNYSVSKNSLSTPLGQTFVVEMYSCPWARSYEWSGVVRDIIGENICPRKSGWHTKSLPPRDNYPQLPPLLPIQSGFGHIGLQELPVRGHCFSQYHGFHKDFFDSQSPSQSPLPSEL